MHTEYETGKAPVPSDILSNLPQNTSGSIPSLSNGKVVRDSFLYSLSSCCNFLRGSDLEILRLEEPVKETLNDLRLDLIPVASRLWDLQLESVSVFPKQLQ